MGNGEVDDDGSFLSDIFYGNFDNDPARISGHYNVKDHFGQKWDVTLVPQWPVVRLPLSKGEFTAFFDRYKTFVADTGLEQPDLVNFSNPISAHKNHSDDMGRFLERADTEFRLLDVPCRLYGNLEGQYPVTTQVLGGFTRDNLSKENVKDLWNCSSTPTVRGTTSTSAYLRMVRRSESPSSMWTPLTMLWTAIPIIWTAGPA